ncbi:hypothetical protein [Caballeronia sp. TF1N1]|uniref:hypothetical protein n=1 Tax=Caballeronia sp. TF1N1 TaxID=2878153 RepID=UPI001FD341DC|nr:hypothetical protein [Caballeronia sp. TF1N1]
MIQIKDRSTKQRSAIKLIRVLLAQESRVPPMQDVSFDEPDPHAQALQRDASGMRPGDVLIEHMQGQEQSE